MPAADDSAKVPVFPPAIFLIALAVGFLLQHFLPLSPGDSWRAAGRVAGYALVAIGALFMFSAVALFRGAGTTPNPTRPTTALVFGGPYRLTRNPMYVGLTLITSGIGLWASTLWPALMALVAAVIVQRVVITREEEYLRRKFGTPYDEYCQRVRRWL